MRSTFNLAVIKPVQAVNPRRGIPVPAPLMSPMRVSRTHIAGGRQ